MFAARNTFLAGAPIGDLSWNSVSMLLKFNGNLTDSAGKHTVTAYGNASVYGGAKFGSYSLYLDGNGDYIQPDAGSDFAFGTGDFTIELWFFLQGLSNSPFLFDWRPYFSVPNCPGMSINYTNSNKLAYYVNGNVITSTTSIYVNTWYHAAVSRNSGTTRLFLNGTQEGGDYSDSNDYTANQPTIGALGYNPALSTYATYGNIDELRITKGVGRYTGNFTVPDKEFPTY